MILLAMAASIAVLMQKTGAGLPVILILIIIAIAAIGIMSAAAFYISKSAGKEIARIADSVDPDKLLSQEKNSSIKKAAAQSAERLLSQNLERLKQGLYDMQTQRDALRAVISYMSDGIIVVEPDKKISMVNGAACNIFGFEEESTPGRTLIAAVMDYEIENLLEQCVQSGKEHAAVVKSGLGRRLLRVVAGPMPNLASYLILIQDLTALKQSEAEMHDFMVNISHELRTPIASIKALAQTLSEGALSDKEVADSFLEKIDVETDRLTQMLQEIGDLSRIEAGAAVIRKSLFSVEDLLNNAVNRLKAQASRSGAALKAEIPADLPWLRADREKLEQVLANLIHNAIKFTPSKGNITVSARTEGDHILFSVSDSGIGIAAADLPRIFERFYKADKARSGSGSGLGLAIARQLVELHHGKIWAESSEGRGSTFYFSIPQS